MSKKKVLLRGVFINRDTNGEGVLKVGTTLIRVSTVMGILYKGLLSFCYGKCADAKQRDEQIFQGTNGTVSVYRRCAVFSGS